MYASQWVGVAGRQIVTNGPPQSSCPFIETIGKLHFVSCNMLFRPDLLFTMVSHHVHTLLTHSAPYN